MKTLFDLQSDRKPGTDHDLLLEAGPDYCAYAYLHRPSNTIDGLRFLMFDTFESADKLSALLEQLPAADDLRSVTICSAFPEAMLVPNRFVAQDSTLLSTLHGTFQAAQYTDPIPEWQLTTVYALPASFDRSVSQRFPSARYFHAYTPGIKIYNGYIADNQVLIHFAAQQFRVLLKKEATIHLAQTYRYNTPLDVVYYLLKICYELGTPQAETHLILSGMIEKDSGLFNEIQHYFQHVHFANPPEMNLPAGDHPQYYFTSLYNLAACVS